MRFLGSLIVAGGVAAGALSVPLQALELEPVAAAESTDCVRVREVRGMDVLNQEMVLLRGSHDRYWLSRLPNKCAGLRDSMILSLNVYGSKYCKNDRFEAADRGGPLALAATTSCRFGAFEPVTMEQVAVIKQAVDES